MPTPEPEAQAGQATADQAWHTYEQKQAEADAAREVSTDLSTKAGLHAQLLDYEADASYDQYVDAWVQENYTQAELDEIEAQNQAEAEI